MYPILPKCHDIVYGAKLMIFCEKYGMTDGKRHLVVR